MRLDLNGEWEARMPDGEMRTVPVPGCFDRGLGRWDEARPVRYRRTFRLEKREPAELFFGGVSYACEISLNGVSLGGHEGLWDGFWVDTRDALREGENELTVVVTKPGYDSNDAYPLRQVLSGFIPDMLATFGGLWDDVALETASPLPVRRVAADGDAEGALRMDAEIRAQADGTALSTLTLFDPDGAPVCTLQDRTALRAGDNAWSQEWRVDAPGSGRRSIPHCIAPVGRWKWMARGGKGIVLAPCDPEVVAPTVDKMSAQNVQTLLLNVDVPQSSRLCYVGSDYVQAGRLAAELLGQMMKGRGRVAPIIFPDRGNMIPQKLTGFREEIGRYPEIEILGPWQILTLHLRRDGRA